MFERFRNFLQTRQGTDATDSVVQAILSNFVAELQSVNETAALNTASDIVGRAFAAARIQSNLNIGAKVMFDIGRSFVQYGEFVGIVVGNRLVEMQIEELKGGLLRENYRYKLRQNSPDGVMHVDASYDEVLHLIYTSRKGQNFRGTSAAELSGLSKQMMINISKALMYELATPQGFILPVPTRDGGSQNLQSLRNTIANMQGRVATIESAQSIANTQGFQRQKEWATVRLGASPPQSLIELLSFLRNEIINLWVPAGLINSQGSQSREAWRQFLFGTIAPMGRLITEQVREKFDSGFTLEFDELRASDITGRARAFNSLVLGGMTLEQAAGLSGILNGDDT